MAEQTATGVVADGHTIHGSGRAYRSGEQFTASAAEIEWLTRSGFLADPRRRVVVRPDGVRLAYKIRYTNSSRGNS